MADPTWVAAWSSGDTASSCRIKQLPLEVLIRISNDLMTTDLCSFRLTCRAIEQLLYVTFTNEFFTRKQFMIADISLQALIDISKSRLGPHLRHLHIGLDRFPDNFQRPLPDDDKERKFRQRYADHFSLWNTGCHRDMLVEAFKHLPNLESVVIRDYNSRKRTREGARAEWSSYGAPTIFDETGIRLSQATIAGWNSNTNFQFSSQVFALVTHALGVANITSLKGIEVMAKNGNQLRDFAFNIPKFSAPTILPVLHRLERLHLSINLGWRAQSAPWTQVAATAPDTMLRQFLCQCTNLKDLRINECHDSPTAMTDLLTWLAGDPNATPNGSKGGDGRAAMPAPPPALDKLEDLSLGWMSVPVAPLIKILRKLAPSLRGLELWKMTLVMPLPPGSDPSDPPRVMFWTDFMNQLRQISGLDLRHIKLGALKQAYLHRPEHHVSFKNRGVEAQYTGRHWKDFVDEVTPLLDIKWPRRLTPESEHSDDGDDDDDLADELSALEDATGESEELDGMDLAALMEDFAPGTIPPAAELLIQELMAQAEEEHEAFMGQQGAYGFGNPWDY
ncbi:F-box domain-containing protein [Purpureocillium lilacinum]|uniref:F-box domain-containing protein n=1 Tax=Purpureocillium lilacinum TaxID=33203 RepID=A0A179GIW2_PURLI|nr:F-box domain-containing protein [Purpureocillium lilacinum]OAQ77059.1 F-box domain-containing protein [Purpureocillium lilacinum]OAQ85933.1 F-box domain-containing protein [Purpureocillium lilacinum]